MSVIPFPTDFESVFTPTPLDLLSLAELRHTAPELALELAAASGRQHDREARDSGRQRNVPAETQNTVE